MKRFLCVFIAFITVFYVSSTALAADGEGEQPTQHTHEYRREFIIVPDCGVDGEVQLVCSCGDAPSSVRAPGCQGERTGETFFRLYAKALAPIGKTPCACTQNLLALTRNKTEKKLLAVRFPYRCTTARSGSSAAWDARPASTRRAACGRNDMSVR